MMEKALYELNIDPEFESLIPPLAPSDYENLAQSINKDGCEDELVVWNGTVVDGHNRYKICHALGIPFAYREKYFASREDAKKWMIQRSFGRRNMSKYDRAVLALRFEDILRMEAETRKKNGVKIDLPPNSADGLEKGDTRDILANLAGVAHEYIDRVKKIEEVADDATKTRLSREETTVNKVYTRLFPKEPKVKEYEPAENEASYAKLTGKVSTPADVEMVGNKGIHTEGRLPDEESSFPVVRSLLEDVARNYLVSLDHILLQYTHGMVTEEHNKEILSMFRGTSQEANNIIKKRIEEVSK